MMIRLGRLTSLIALLVVLLATSACAGPLAASPSGLLPLLEPVDRVEPRAVQEIPLAGPIATPGSEISGMAWYGDWLVLLPQFPDRFGDGAGALFLLPRVQIQAVVQGTMQGPLTPRILPLLAPGIERTIPGFEGYEAIAFDEGRAFVTVEADLGTAMQGWLLSGYVEPNLSALHLQVENRQPLPPQADYANMSDEALVLVQGSAGASVVTFYEANGRLATPDPVARVFSLDLQPQIPVPMPHLEYRLTDATSLDGRGRFWVSNYFWPGEVQILSGQYPLQTSLRRLVQAGRLEPVERLVELEYDQDGIRTTETPPILLTGSPDGPSNWEGIARLGERGLLIVTDRFPRTRLAFVPFD